MGEVTVANPDRRRAEESNSLARQAVGLRIAAAEAETSIACRESDLNQIFHSNTGTTFREALLLLEKLGIVRVPGDELHLLTKVTERLEPTNLLEDGELGWHLKRLSELGHPIESVEDLVRLDHEVDRLAKLSAQTAALGSHSFSFDPRNASILLNVNGELKHRFDASVSVFDSAIAVGDGLWESFRVKDGTILFFDEHMDRLEATARGIGLKLDYTREEYKGMLVDVLKANGMTDDTHIRFIITAGDKYTPLASRGTNFGPQNVIIIPEFKTHLEPEPLKTARTHQRRGSSATLDPGLHILSKGGDVNASNIARALGVNEVLMQDDRGNYAAFNSTSFFLAKDDIVYMPRDVGLLRGVTRKNIERVCKELGIQIVKKDITDVDLAEATACFATGTAGGICPVASIDTFQHYDVDSPVIARIRRGYEALLERETRKRENSIHHVPGFHEQRRLVALQDELQGSTREVSRVLTAARSQSGGTELTATTLEEFDNAIDRIRKIARDANHTVALPAGLRTSAISQFHGGTPELGFVPQFAFSERMTLNMRALLVQQLREEGVLPVKETKNIQLWSSPRNMSTALMRAFERRDDTRVFDEVLYACYLQRVAQGVREKHPGFDEVVGALEADERKLVEELILGPHTRDVVFFKQMTHHLFGAEMDRSFLACTTNVLLTRPPRDMIASFAKDLRTGAPTMQDVGYEQQGILFHELKDRTGQAPIVLDSELLLANPEGVLRELCERLGLEFEKEMLRWPKGASAFDGIWGRYWYRGVTRSDRFGVYQAHEIPEGRPEIYALVEECKQHYQPLREAALRG